MPAKPIGTTRFDAIVAEANRLNKVAPPYSNTRPPSDDIGYDCSSSCAQLMRTAGYTNEFFNTASFQNVSVVQTGEDPTGRLTFWDNDVAQLAGTTGAHMFATISGHDWGTGANPQGGPGWHTHTKVGFKPFHITGLNEPASVPRDANTTTPGGNTDNSGSASSSDPTSIAKAAAFSTFLELPGVFDTFESQALTGQKSLMNDQPLLPFVQNLCQGSLRNFMSMPNGNFFAFYPDYFGGLSHRTPYWAIEDIEIIDGGIDLSDDALATHVYVVGDILGFDGQVDITDKLFSSGVVTIFNAFLGDFLNGTPDPAKPPRRPPGSKNHPSQGTGLDVVDPTKPTLGNKDAALAFLQKYGARPSFQAMPMIRSPFFELFVAYQTFCLMWSQQFLTTFEFTFMPELFPGGIVAFPEHGIQCYVDEVVHEFDYESGFVTRANLSAPAALPSSDRQGVQAGMIRSYSFSPNDQPFDPFASQTDTSKGAQVVPPGGSLNLNTFGPLKPPNLR